MFPKQTFYFPVHAICCLLMIAGCNSDYDDICDRKTTRDELVSSGIVSVQKGGTALDVCADQLRDHLQQESFRRFVFWVQQCITGRSEQKFSVKPCFDDLITFWGPDGEKVDSKNHAMEVELKLAYFLKDKKPTKDRFVAYLNGEDLASIPIPAAGLNPKRAEETEPKRTYIPEPDFDEPEVRKKKKRKKRKRSKRKRSKKRTKNEK
jgi:hypothetical protein